MIGFVVIRIYTKVWIVGKATWDDSMSLHLPCAKSIRD